MWNLALKFDLSAVTWNCAELTMQFAQKFIEISSTECRISIFWVQNLNVLHEHRILGGLFRVPMQFLSTKIAFSEHKFTFLSAEFPFFERTEFVFSECRICIFLVWNSGGSIKYNFFMSYKVKHYWKHTAGVIKHMGKSTSWMIATDYIQYSCIPIHY